MRRAWLFISEKPAPFDFIINGELLHTSLEKFLLQRSISAVRLMLFPSRTARTSGSYLISFLMPAADISRSQEAILTVEYIPALGPLNPKARAAFAHLDCFKSCLHENKWDPWRRER